MPIFITFVAQVGINLKNTFMKSFIKCAFSFFILSICFSCLKQKTDIEGLFREVENLVEEQPDSALNRLDAVQNPYALNKERQARYYLRLTQAKDKAFKNISNDTLIFQSKNYYQEKKDMENLTLAAFYSGRVYQSQREYEKALQAYLEAVTTSEKIDDDNLKGLITYYIGDIYYSQRSYNEAIDKFKQAQVYFSRSTENYKREIAVFNIIGNSFFIKEQRDSAFVYFDKAFRLAEIHKDTVQQMRVKQNLGVAYRTMGNFSLAKEYLLSALAFKNDEELEATIYLNLAQVYNELNLKDSVEYYAHTALAFFEKKNKASSLSNAYRLLASMAEKHKDYKQALEYHLQYSKYLADIVNENKDHNIQEVEKKYHFELLQNEKNRLRNKNQSITIFALGLSLAFFALYFYFFRKNMRYKATLLKRENEIAMEKTALAEAERELFSMKKLNAHFSDRENKFKNLILENLEIYKRACLLEKNINQQQDKSISPKDFVRKINELLYMQKELNWDKLFDMLNELSNDFFKKIKEHYPQLTDLEFKIICLDMADFDNLDIALILKREKNTIQQGKSGIRNKLGIESRASIKIFFQNNIRPE
jgi:tetratricopeptide (TPR) repeat protein